MRVRRVPTSSPVYHRGRALRSEQGGKILDRTFDTFIFDLDGTLLDTLPDLVVLTNAALRAEGYPERTEAEILSFVGNGVKALMLQAIPDGTDATAAERAVRRWKELFPVLDNNLTKPYRGMPETLDGLRERG